jgi:anti-anti-sigma factor
VLDVPDVPLTSQPEWEPFRCEVVPERESVRVQPVGELDMATVPKLRQALEELVDAGFRRLVLDLARVRFMDSTGLRLLIAARSDVHAGGGRLTFLPGPPQVQRIFDVTGLGDLFFADEG